MRRLIALASALLLIGTGAVWAQTNPFADQLQSAQSGAGGGGSTGSRAGGAAAAAAAAAAQGGGTTFNANPLSGATSANAAVSQATEANQNGLRPVFITMADGTYASVYGTELFTGSFAGTRPSDRPDYTLQTGDQVVVNMYGAVNNGSAQIVDSKGNIFIVGVGPVHVAGVSAGSLQGVIAGAVGRVFTSAVSVYTTVGSAGTIGVFVSGDISRPGRYVGGPHDDVMFYLSQAGGVDAARGSFRNVTIRRSGRDIATYDLYDFLLKGKVAPFTFEDGDVVFVGARGPMVSVTGQTRNDRAFEAPAGGHGMTGADVIPLARPEPTVIGVLVHGIRNNEPKTAYFSLEEFTRVVLSDGDHLDFVTGGLSRTVSVSIEGQVDGPSYYVVPDGSTLGQLMAKLPLQGTNVETRWVHVRRASVAAEQKRALQQALFNLQKQVLTASPPTSASAALAASQAALITQFVQQAQNITPDGNIAVYNNGQFQDMQLQEGDVVILPSHTDVVMVSGEVINPGGLSHTENMDIVGYVDRAGGFAAHANKHKMVLRHADGSAVVAKPGDKPLPGDDIIIVPNVGSDKLQVFIDLTQLLFQMALSTATVISVSKNL
jgi:protein involved in polysaccharide export with SLBB domain